MTSIIQHTYDFEFRLAIEKAILTTLLFKDLNTDADFDKLCDYKLDHNLFNTNKTNKLVAKAIFNHIDRDQPYDEELIARYIKKHTTINEEEYLAILASKPISIKTFDEYVKQLKTIVQQEKILEMMRDA